VARATDPAQPATFGRLGRRIFAGLTVATFVLAETWLLASAIHQTLGLVLLGFGVLVMIGHVALDVLRHASR
jgi:ubiquinone biosynthesis protein